MIVGVHYLKLCLLVLQRLLQRHQFILVVPQHRNYTCDLSVTLKATPRVRRFYGVSDVTRWRLERFHHIIELLLLISQSAQRGHELLGVQCTTQYCMRLNKGLIRTDHRISNCTGVSERKLSPNLRLL